MNEPRGKQLYDDVIAAAHTGSQRAECTKSTGGQIVNRISTHEPEKVDVLGVGRAVCSISESN